MPKCPFCDKEMKENDYGIWVCKNCKGVFVPEKKHTGPSSIFGGRAH